MENRSAYCVEYFYAKPEYLQELISALSVLVEKTRVEPLCEQYDLLQDKENPNLLIILMKFGNEAAMKAHEEQPYVQQFSQSDMKKFCEKVVWNDACRLV